MSLMSYFIFGSSRRRSFRLVLVLALGTLTLSGVAQERDRAKIPDKYKWNLADVYPTDAAWRQAKEKVAGEIPGMQEFKGKLASAPKTLADALGRRGMMTSDKVEFPLRLNHIADATGLTTVHVRKLQTEFQRLGLIDLKDRSLALLDRA